MKEEEQRARIEAENKKREAAEQARRQRDIQAPDQRRHQIAQAADQRDRRGFGSGGRTHQAQALGGVGRGMAATIREVTFGRLACQQAT